MVRFVRRIPSASLEHARCRYCDRDIVLAPEIGWLDPTPGSTYDMCPDAPYADHEPSDSRGDTKKV